LREIPTNCKIAVSGEALEITANGIWFEMTKICAAAMLVRDSKILLGKRAPGQLLYPDVWDLPGGHLEAGESVDQALIRELMEELGIVPTRFVPLGKFDELNPEKYGAQQYHVYLVTEWSGLIVNRQPHEHSEIRWVSLETAHQLELADPRYPGLFRRIGSF
jgi:8-oxo-dGTP diphosphatase